MQHSFETTQALSDHQAERELQEALRVQNMSPTARWQWLQDTWGRLQDGSAFLSANDQLIHHGARCYATLAEKNRFDEAREIQQALQLPIHRARPT